MVVRPIIPLIHKSFTHASDMAKVKYDRCKVFGCGFNNSRCGAHEGCPRSGTLDFVPSPLVMIGDPQ